jgi:hypothetical protein
MPLVTIESTLRELPADATNGEALEWVEDMRRILHRWDALPGREKRSMTPDLKRLALAEFDKLENMIRRNMI